MRTLEPVIVWSKDQKHRMNKRRNLRKKMNQLRWDNKRIKKEEGKGSKLLWKKGRELKKTVYRIVRQCPKGMNDVSNNKLR